MASGRVCAGVRGVDKTATLWVLGQPVTFTVQLCTVEGCLQPRHKGPCKGSGRGGAVKKAVTGKKAAAPAKKTVAPKKAVPKAEKSYADRVAEVKALTAKPEHHGVPMKRIKQIFADLGAGQGRRFDRPTMTLHYSERTGTGEMRMVPKGYETVVSRHGEPVQRRTFRDIAAANSFVRGNLLISGR